MIKIYFACSITGGGDNSSYLAIIQTIKDANADVISEVFAHDAINLGGSPLPAPDIYQRDVQMIKDADAIIAEVTNPSLGVGYELAYAEKLGKPVLGVFNIESGRRLSAMIKGNPAFQVAEYTNGKVPAEEIRDFIKQISELNQQSLQIQDMLSE